jgi:hypothetical protein
MLGPMTAKPWIGATFVCLLCACGTRVVDDGGEVGNTESGSESETGTQTETETDTGAPLSCAEIAPEDCSNFEDCVAVSASEATLDDQPGAYYCSDIALPFACVDAPCEPQFGVFCEGGDPEIAMWFVDTCIPSGWEPCPDDGVCL